MFTMTCSNLHVLCHLRVISILIAIHIFPMLVLAVSPHMRCHYHPEKCSNATTTTDVPKVSGICMEQCNAHRVRGNTEKYTWNCFNTASDDQARLNCKDTCDMCPETVCDAQSPNLFNCPPIELEGKCVERCNSRRPTSGAAFELNCFEAYRNTYDRKVCETECQQHCSFICTKSGPHKVFQCPSGSRTPNIFQTTWFVVALVILIPCLILLTIIIWRCVFRSRSASLGRDAARRQGQSYQQQLHQDPFNFIAANDVGEKLVALTPSVPLVPVAVSSVTCNTQLRDDYSLSVFSETATN